MHVNVKPNIDWVGYVDWTVRDFHGYHTNRGSTYNAYLIRDEKNVLVDAVKGPYAGHLLRQVRELLDPADVHYVVCNHAEPDHSSALPEVMTACSNAQLVCNEKCRDALSRHFDVSGWSFKIVSDGESLSIGARSLVFIDTPMAHWPESMFTYVPEEKLLFSMDAFGQHYASSGRFDDEEPLDIVMLEARTYYANIVMPYGKQVAKVMEKAGGLDIEMVAPSHGVIWRTHLSRILEAYGDWVVCRPKAKTLVVYDTMWGSTEIMARAVVEGAIAAGVEARLYAIRKSNITILATEILDAGSVGFGTPTLNRTMMPEMGALLTYYKGLRPQNKVGAAFGSYGWAKGGAKDVLEALAAMKFEILDEPVQSRYVPSEDVLEECRALGRKLGEAAREKAKAAERS